MGMKTGILIALLLLSTLTLAFNIQPAKTTGTRPNGSPKQTAVDWWPSFHHDLRHTGYSTSEAPDDNHTLWSYHTGGNVESSPAVADGKVYVGSEYSGFCGRVYAFDALTGGFIWSYQTDNWARSSPAVADGKVYVGSDDGKVYALNALTGGFIWSYQTGGCVFSSPAVADGKVYVGSQDRKVYALNALTGAFIWSYQTGDWVWSSPAVADGKVYVGSDDGRVYAFDALTGGFIWSYQTGDDVESSPAVADGKVYVGSQDRKVYALNALTGAFIWSYQTGGCVFSSPAVADGKVYVGSFDWWVYAFDALTGGFIWSYQTGGAVESSPAVADGKVYVGSDDGRVYAFDALTGGFIWSYQTDNWARSSPAVADGKVYVGSSGSGDGWVYAFSSFHDVAITNVTPSKTVADQGYEADINVTVTNQGDFTETFNVTLYAKTEQAINEAGLVGHWKFDEGTGTTAHDSSGNGNNGTLINGPQWVDGKYGKALSFDGVNDYVAVPHSNSLDFERTDSFTISSWITVDSLSDYRNIIGKNDNAYRGWNLILLSSSDASRPNSVCLVLTNTNIYNDLLACSPANSISAGNTYHIAATYNGSSDVSGVKIYINGVPQTVTPIRNGLSASIQTANETWIGRHGWAGGSYPFDGIIDDIRIYNRALSASEIWAEYAGSVGHWKFDEGSGTTAYDSSGNSNNGTLVNGPVWVDGKLGKALSFDGVDDYLYVNDTPILKPAAITVEAWFKRSAHDSYDAIVSKWDHLTGNREYQIDIGTFSTNRISWMISSNGYDCTPLTSSTTISDDIWYHIVGTYNGSRMILYVNGMEENSTSYSNGINGGNSQLRIGHSYDGTSGYYFNGIIDEVKIYNRALSAEEIWAEYTRSLIAIQTQTVTLESGASTTLTFNWNTTGFAKGNYTISAYAWPVPGETDLSDNTFVDGSIYVAMLGDITADGKVDIFDIVIVALHFNHIPPNDHLPGTSDYFACFNADINNDGIIDIFDIVIVALHFGEVDP